jgi:sugar phosphate isomerase/epimerase
MYLTGFADEAAADIDGQIRATTVLGWRYIESRNIGGKNIHDISEREFDTVCEKLDAAGVRINCFGSAIGNWAKKITDPPDTSYAEMQRAIPRMKKLGTKLIRVMSFVMDESDSRLDNAAVAGEVIRRMKVLVKMGEDSGITLVHENCNAWGGRSYEHTMRLLEAVRSPNLRLVFDTGNPVGDKDVRGKPPYHYQDAWEFYSNVKEHVIYVHIKDGRIADGKLAYCFPGDGDGHVRTILKDLHTRGYDGGFSMEPHMAVVHHEAAKKTDDQIRFDNYVEYGRRFEKLLGEELRVEKERKLLVDE